MTIIEKNKAVLDERLYSEAFRKNILASPVIEQKQKQADEVIKALPKQSRKQAK